MWWEPDEEGSGEPPAKRARSRRAINKFERAAIERRRLMRVLETVSRAPTAGEMDRLDKLVAKVQPKRRPGQFFVAMHAVTLTKATLDKIDLNGFFALKADGIHSLMARVTTDKTPMVRGRVAREEAAVVREQPSPDVPLGERYDTMLFVTRDDRVRAIDRVFVHEGRKQLLFDGELCLRKKELSQDELWRVRSAHNVHEGTYLDYYTYADDTASDVASDEHQKQYDHYYELVYAAFDCLVIKERQLNKTYLERLTLLRDLTETPLAQEALLAYKRQIETLRIAAHYAGGAENFTIPVFLKPPFAVRDARAGMHAVPRAMYGIATDGVIFNPNRNNYVCGFNDNLLKYKIDHTVDFTLGRQGSEFALSVQRRGELRVVAHRLCVDNECAEELLLNHANNKDVLECEGILTETPDSHGERIAWRPVLFRSEKDLPNSVRNYENVLEAIHTTLTEEELITSIETRLRLERQRRSEEDSRVVRK